MDVYLGVLLLLVATLVAAIAVIVEQNRAGSIFKASMLNPPATYLPLVQTQPIVVLVLVVPSPRAPQHDSNRGNFATRTLVYTVSPQVDNAGTDPVFPLVPWTPPLVVQPAPSGGTLVDLAPNDEEEHVTYVGPGRCASEPSPLGGVLGLFVGPIDPREPCHMASSSTSLDWDGNALGLFIPPDESFDTLVVRSSRSGLAPLPGTDGEEVNVVDDAADYIISQSVDAPAHGQGDVHERCTVVPRQSPSTGFDEEGSA